MNEPVTFPSLYHYQAGGSLPVTAPSYVQRQADEELFQALLKGLFCYVLNARQMGKSSLRVRVTTRLQAEGVRTGAIDMTMVGSQQISAEQWYASVLQSMISSFRLSINLRSWWRERSHLSPVKRFSEFLETVLLVEIQQPIVIFIDEIDSVLGLPFPIDDFFALIRACYNQRVENPLYQRLTFALFGVATPSDLIADKSRTPFNIGQAIELHGFRVSEALPLLPGLAGTVKHPEAMLRHMLEWTGGQPFLTQKLCQLVQDAWQEGHIGIPAEQESQWLDDLVRSRLIHAWELQDEPEHLRTIPHRLLHDEQRSGRLLGLYQQILAGEKSGWVGEGGSRRQRAQADSTAGSRNDSAMIPFDNSPDQTELLLSGLVVKDQGYLRVRNPIYAEVFNQDWVEQHLTQLRPYAVNLKEWLKSGRVDDSRLLQGQALREAEIWAEGKRIGDQDYQFLAASRSLEQREQQRTLEAARTREVEARLVQEKKTARLQRRLLQVISLALVAAIALGIAAFWQYRGAVLSEIQAITQVSAAQFASDRKLDALVEALRAHQKLQQMIAVDAQIKNQSVEVLRQTVYGAVEANQLVGHQNFVFGVAIRPDGQEIATASSDQTVKFWSPQGKLLKTITGFQGWVIDLEYSPDGQTFITVEVNGTVKIWQRNGTLLRMIGGNRIDGLTDFDVSADGKRIAVPNRNGMVKVWQVNGDLVQAIATHQESVFGVALSPDGQTLATTGKDHTVKLWDMQGQLLQTLIGHQKQVNAVAISPDGRWLATGGSDQTVKLWRRNGELLKTLEGHTGEIWDITFSPDGQWFASSSGDQTVRIWNLEGALLMTLNQGESVWRSAFSPDKTWLVSGDSNNNAKLWQFQNPTLQHLRGHQDWVSQVAFSPDGQQVASASWDRTVKLWTRSGVLLSTFRGHQTRTFAVAFHPDGKRLASADASNLIQLWQRDGTVLRTFSLVSPTASPTSSQLESAEVGRVDFSPDGQLLAAGNDGLTEANVWRSDGTLVATLKGHQQGINSIRFSPDGQRLATASYRTIKLWTVEGKLLQTLKGHQTTVADVAFSPDGQHLVSVGHDRTVRLWSRDGKLLRTFRGHSRKVYAVAFSPDGKMIASGGRDLTVKLWTLDGTLVANLKAHTRVIESIAFSPDGQHLASTGWDNTVIVWNLQRAIDPNRLAAIGCDWVRNYVQNNPEMKQNANLCGGSRSPYN